MDISVPSSRTITALRVKNNRHDGTTLWAEWKEMSHRLGFERRRLADPWALASFGGPRPRNISNPDEKIPDRNRKILVEYACGPGCSMS